MAVTIDATVGGDDTNSYLTLAAADTIAESLMNTDGWDAATDAAKNIALVQATADIDTLKFRGRKWYWQYQNESDDNFQALEFPRTMRYDEYDGYDVKLVPSESSTLTIPVKVQRATVVQAIHLIDFHEEFRAASRARDSGIKEIEVGHFREVFTGGGGTQNIVCKEARMLLKHWLKSGPKVMRG